MKATVVLAVVLAASAAWAQQPAAADRPAAPPPAPDSGSTRYQIAVMERVLEQAVQHGAASLMRQLQSVAPNLGLFSGPARARGFRLEGHGYFFAVDVPALRQSVTWTFRALHQPDPLLMRALQSLKQHVQSLSDTQARESLEAALERVEGQVGPIVPQGTSPGAGSVRATALGEPAGASPAAAPDPGVLDAELLEDPNQRYTDEVRRALIDAMLDHGSPLSIAADEWLTVAARDDEGRLTPAEIYESSTLILRIRGDDLAAFRADRLSREEARKRVEVRDF